MEINGGRFYARRLRADKVINDIPALENAFQNPVNEDFVEQCEELWHTDEKYFWAICEQTRVEMLACAVFQRQTNPPKLTVLPSKPLDTLLPNDPGVEQRTVADAVVEGERIIRHWVNDYLGIDL